MTSKQDEKELYENAKEKVRKIKIFYLHLILYIIVVALLVYNFSIMEGPYTDAITGLNVSVLVFWTLFICIHAWSVFKGKFLFNENWEDRKIEQILEDKEEEIETTFWE